MKIYLVTLISLWALLTSPEALASKIRVVSTIPDFGAIAEAIGGDRVDVTTLVKPTQDPHFVDAKPSLVLALNQADLLLTAGMELEGGWLPPLLNGARNRDIMPGTTGHLECASLITPMEVRSVDRSQGDIHPGGNPHFWIDPRNGLRIAKGIAERLKTIDPSNAAVYDAGRDSFVAKLEQAMTRWKKALAPLLGTRVVVYHESWVYFLDWSGLVQAGALEPKPGIPPTPSHVAGLIKRVEGLGVRFTLQESFYPTQLSNLFAAKSGAVLKVMPTMTGARGTTSYIDMIDSIVKELTR
jgi:zinc/manganese transport system substrate-binding protein